MDIVDRLRGGVYGLDRIPLCHDAADEIESLRSEVARLTCLWLDACKALDHTRKGEIPTPQSPER